MVVPPKGAYSVAAPVKLVQLLRESMVRVAYGREKPKGEVGVGVWVMAAVQVKVGVVAEAEATPEMAKGEPPRMPVPFTVTAQRE